MRAFLITNDSDIWFEYIELRCYLIKSGERYSRQASYMTDLPPHITKMNEVSFRMFDADTLFDGIQCEYLGSQPDAKSNHVAR